MFNRNLFVVYGKVLSMIDLKDVSIHLTEFDNFKGNSKSLVCKNFLERGDIFVYCFTAGCQKKLIEELCYYL